MPQLNSSEFTKALIDFRQQLEEQSPAEMLWTEKTVLSAFSLWYMDTREQEAWEEAKKHDQESKKHEQEDLGEGWKSGGDD